jgi:hypothetical protein
MMAQSPSSSLPKQCASGGWADLKAAYRLLSNEAVSPHDLQSPHQALTREACASRPVVLCVQDTSELDYTTRRERIAGLGPIGDGHGWGMLQHSALAVTPEGRLLGVLNQIWHVRTPVSEGETAAQRRRRWRESMLFSDTVRAVGQLEGTRLVHVADRGADVAELMHQCRREHVGFVFRAAPDRCVGDGSDHLWNFVAASKVLATQTVPVAAQKGHGATHPPKKARAAKVQLRGVPVTLDAPKDQRGLGPLSALAVLVREHRPPKNTQGLEWMLLTSEGPNPGESMACWAQRIVPWYRHRWLIEEWHRALKEGCRLEDSQLDQATDIARLAAVLSVVAVRLIQLKQLAAEPHGGADEPTDAIAAAALRACVPAMWIRVVAKVGRADPDRLTPRQFWHAIARRGGWIGRKNDRPPGWKVIWRGWSDIALLVSGAELFAPPDTALTSG